MIQLHLPAAPIYEPWLQNCAFLLQRANSGCRNFSLCPGHPENLRDRFYNLKSEILMAHGHHQGFDLQHLEKKCWTCGGAGLVVYDDESAYCGRCNGTGLYSERFILLARYSLAGRIFHCPAGDIQTPEIKPNIEGLIQHLPSPHAWEAFRVLADGRYSLQARCTNQAAQDLIMKIQFEERDADSTKSASLPF